MARRRRKGRERGGEQLELPFRQHGGARRGTGRKLARPRREPRHEARPELPGYLPVHVVTHLLPGLPGLRCTAAQTVLERAIAAAQGRFGMRVVHFSIQREHLHFLVEHEGRRSLERAMKGLLVRAARGLNRMWRRTGPVFEGRYYARVLRTPREVRNALIYVLQNALRHDEELAEGELDAFSSARELDGWVVGPGVGVEARVESRRKGIVVAPRTWLMSVGWRRLGLLRVDERPKKARVASGSR